MLEELKRECRAPAEGQLLRDLLFAKGYLTPLDDENTLAAIPMRRAGAFAALLTAPCHVYPHDRIVGSLRGLFGQADPDKAAYAASVCTAAGSRSFSTNLDHFTPDYAYLLREGIGGIISRLRDGIRHFSGRRAAFSAAALHSMNAFSAFILRYADAAEAAGLSDAADCCRSIALDPPKTFREALQLVWLTHLALVTEGRMAMALGRLDQYLYPFYRDDIAAGRLTRADALDLMGCCLIKIGEVRTFFGGDDFVNIAIGGVTRSGEDAVNELSSVILEAVRDCHIPGPNLSARIGHTTSQQFIVDCLRVIGTGIGYPALMNDDVNIASLIRRGTDPGDARDYCMVGCIENFLPGKQPPWSDGRFNTPKFLELALNGGVCMLTGKRIGAKTPPPEEICSMEELLHAFSLQLNFAAQDYVLRFANDNARLNPWHYTQPFLSCLCEGCVTSGRDVNDGGTPYPSVHGVGLMGIATVADSLAAIEKTVFEEKICTLSELCCALRTDFAQNESLRARLLSAPKYGNNDEYADKYARFFVDEQYAIFSRYRTPDGGPYSIGIASNISNIPAGAEVAATPDGRHARQPLSDAASVTPGRDHCGPGAALLSLSKPDYAKSAVGTVVNQKYTPHAFREENLDRLAAMIRVYFSRGGQELQINAVSRDTLIDAMEHPDNYASLIVRVSGFSAYYTCLPRDIQQDILRRTEHDA